MAKLTKRKLGQVRLAPGTLRSTRFIIKEVRVSAEHGPIALIDMEGVGHGFITQMNT